MKFYLQSVEVTPEMTLQSLAERGLCNLSAETVAFFKATYKPIKEEPEPKDDPTDWTQVCIQYEGLSTTADNFFFFGGRDGGRPTRVN